MFKIAPNLTGIRVQIAWPYCLLHHNSAVQERRIIIDPLTFPAIYTRMHFFLPSDTVDLMKIVYPGHLMIVKSKTVN